MTTNNNSDEQCNNQLCDNESTWQGDGGNELGNITERIAAENDLECAVTSFLEDPVDEIQEFEYICENIEIEE